jgi:hypothetical protein|tara:strand:- start:716 stop:1324 length:609 start_codon:yes stop_codon:yes gene_type:complete
MKLNLEKVEKNIFENLNDYINNGETFQGADGIVFHYDRKITAKLFTGSPEEMKEKSTIQYGLSKICFENEISVPEPYSLIENRDIDLDEGQIALPTKILLMERIKDGKEVPNLQNYEFMPQRRRRGNLSKKHLGFAREQYYEQLKKIHDLGIVVEDSSLFWNTLYSPKRKKLYFIDQARWYFGDNNQLDLFNGRIEKKYRLF